MRFNVDGSIFGFSSLSIALGSSYLAELTQNIMNLAVGISSIVSTSITIVLIVIKVIKAIKTKNLKELEDSIKDIEVIVEGDKDDTRD